LGEAPADSGINMEGIDSPNLNFTCSICGEEHEINQPPVYTFEAPSTIDEYVHVNVDKDRYYEVKEGDNAHFYIKAVLVLRIHGCTLPFVWMIWVSVSKESFSNYMDILSGTMEVTEDTPAFFGYVMNKLPYMPGTLLLKTKVLPHGGGKVPQVVVMEESSGDLAKTFYHGMSKQEAQELIEKCIHSPEDFPP
jgi:hypothetical protein